MGSRVPDATDEARTSAPGQSVVALGEKSAMSVKLLRSETRCRRWHSGTVALLHSPSVCAAAGEAVGWGGMTLSIQARMSAWTDRCESLHSRSLSAAFFDATQRPALDQVLLDPLQTAHVARPRSRGSVPASMPARDLLHDAVRNALVRDGWTITDDPLRLKVPGRNLYVDLGAERVLAAERGALAIAVEVKSFLGPSDVSDLEDALGQFVLYELVLRRVEPRRQLFLAIPETAWKSVFAEALGEIVLGERAVRLLVIDSQKEVIVQWIPSTPGETPSNAS